MNKYTYLLAVLCALLWGSPASAQVCTGEALPKSSGTVQCLYGAYTNNLTKTWCLSLDYKSTITMAYDIDIQKEEDEFYIYKWNNNGWVQVLCLFGYYGVDIGSLTVEAQYLRFVFITDGSVCGATNPAFAGVDLSYTVAEQVNNTPVYTTAVGNLGVGTSRPNHAIHVYQPYDGQSQKNVITFGDSNTWERARQVGGGINGEFSMGVMKI